MDEQELIEALADKEHQGLARWMVYLLNKFPRAENGDVVLPAGYVAALENQMNTAYGLLTPAEQQLDRDEVAHILPIIRQYAEDQARQTSLAGAPAVVLHERLRWIRRARGWTLAELSQRSRTSIAFLSDMELGARGVVPSLATLQRIADSYGLSVGELLVNVHVGAGASEQAEAGG